jgi:UDP-N-acetylmuramate dehydrogenase
MKIEEQKSLAPFTTWQVGGMADFYTAPRTQDELKQALRHAYKNHWPVTLLGGGSNVLISDQGVAGLVIHTHHLNRVRVLSEQPELVVEAEAGASKSEVLKIFLKYRLAPATFLAGLPGDMGGGVVMNAGVGHHASPKEFREIVQDFDVLGFCPDGHIEQRRYNVDEVQWGYRRSSNWQPGVISQVRVRWPNQPNDEVLKEVRQGNKRRKTTQPLNEPSCGSVFKNPEGDHAGRLIEACGLKGYSRGGSQVSEKHANFIVNKGGATAMEIQKTIEHVQTVVEKQFNIKLTNEVVYLGRWNSSDLNV